jgi:histidinol-phosphate/aromatic aminotransferase/cobyric acid decarboxylase-like protein
MGRPPDTQPYLPASTHGLLDLATGHNPYGPAPGVREAAQRAVDARDLDGLARATRDAVALRFQTPPERVLLGAGASELAWTAARALVQPESVWLSVEPAQSPSALAARGAGARVTRWRSVERTGHTVDLEQVAELMRLEAPAVVSLCAPGSPTGASVPAARLSELAARFPGTQLVVDQSWLPLSDDHADLEWLPPDNVLCLRSLSLEHALPGLRAGYALGSPTLLERMRRARPPYLPGAPALAALQAALLDPTHSASSRRQLQADRARLRALLDALGLTYTPSVAPFLLVRVARATEVMQELRADHGIAVCDATPFGLPDHLRICAPSERAAPQLKAALEQVLGRRKLVRGREA